ncbi:MAG: FAD-binding protein [Elusimicrobia bacterium]|nr:FAD-binding protein [Elusimicrobiota bacterium]
MSNISSDPGDLYLASLDQGQVPQFLRQGFVRQPLGKAAIGSLEELQNTVRSAYDKGIPIIARGSGSSGFGQVLPRSRALILDLAFLNRILEFNPDEKTVRVETGVRWSDLDRYLENEGFAIGSYPSSYYTSIGGWIATGGLGLCAYKFGHIKNQILEIQALDSRGQIHRLARGDEEFDAFFSSEGQTGVLYSVTLKVRPKPQGTFPTLISFDETARAMDFIHKLTATDLDIVDLTYLSREKITHMEHNLRQKMVKKGSPLAEPHFKVKDSVFALFESAAELKKYEQLLADLNLDLDRGKRFSAGESPLNPVEAKPLSSLRILSPQCGERMVLGSGGKGDSPALNLYNRGARLNRSAASLVWFERFYPMKGKGAENFYLGNEVLIGLKHAAPYVERLRRIARGRKVHDLAMEAHIIKEGASCLFLAYYPVARNTQRLFSSLAAAVEFDFAALKFDGKIYPIGIYKTPFLNTRFRAETIALIKKVKMKFDPKNLFNPGKFFSWGSGLPWPSGLVWNLLTKFAGLGMRLLALTAPVLDSVLGPFLRRPEQKILNAIAHDPVARAAFECVQCGFCIPICPAYLATRDEKTTARGKLMLYAAKDLAPAGHFKFSPLDAKMLQMCMHCAGCTKVCQSEIDLVPAWHRLETGLVETFGQPREEIKEFVKSVEDNPEYHRLLREGAIVKEAPRKLPAGVSGL